jgi:hypothetical protein
MNTCISTSSRVYILVETPNNEIEIGHLEHINHVLGKIKGTNHVNLEFNKLIQASMYSYEFNFNAKIHNFHLYISHACQQ